MNPTTLSALADLLNKGGKNYTVFLHCYLVPQRFGGTAEDLISAALGRNTVVGGVRMTASGEMLAEIRSSIGYAGDSGAGPDPSVIQSADFGKLLTDLLKDVDVAARAATKIEQFWLKEGHPAYPVFWDFAFLLTGTREAVVLIGSSSD